jgi:UDP-arabinose 4-epimerase
MDDVGPAPPVLVVGGAGFIGSHTCKALAESGFTPIVFDNLSRGHADAVQWGPLVRGDILDPQALEDAFVRYRPQSVIHFAALAYVGESTKDPLSYYAINTSGLVNVLKCMVAHGVARIVFSSSCATYGIPDKIPVTEDAPQRPISPYGRSKLMGEQIIGDAAEAHNLTFGILRYFNACGADPTGHLGERHDPETHIIPLAIDAAIGRGPPLQIFGSDYPTRDGTCERDYIHVTDLAEAHVSALQAITSSSRSLTLNIGTGRPHSLLDVLATIERVTGRSVPVVWAPRRNGDPPSIVADRSRATRILGFRPVYSDLETIIRTAARARDRWTR